MKLISFIPVTSEQQRRITHYWIIGTFAAFIVTCIILALMYKPLIARLFADAREIKKLELLIGKETQILTQHAYLKNMQQKYNDVQNKLKYYENHPNILGTFFELIVINAQQFGTIEQLDCNKRKISLLINTTDVRHIHQLIEKLQESELIKKIVIASLSEKSNDNKQYLVSLAITSTYQPKNANSSSKQKL